jgi:hypothetical protein
MRLLLVAGTALALTGCGLGETAVSAAAAGSTEVQQAQQAKALENQLHKQLDDAAKAAESQRQGAEKAAE